ncbi:MAG: hypothetical protein HYV65_02005 [Candidatus Spechtbacteria bacterium]|nr:hypothetical protein [Candidatus Spechtbacteria bacterium]
MPLTPFLFEYLISGFFATVVMTLSVFFLRNLLGIHLNIPVMLGSMILPGAAEQWHRRIGMTSHLLIGSVLGLIFGLLVYNKILFYEFTLLNCIGFAILSWLVMMAVLMPISGRGLWGFKQHEHVWVASLAGHVIYGGALYTFHYLLFIVPYAQ